MLSDSEDEVEESKTKAATPRKAASKKRHESASPVGERMTTSDYFASSRKSMPTRSTPSKPKKDAHSEAVHKEEDATVNATPASRKVAKNEKVSSRRKATHQLNHTEESDAGVEARKVGNGAGEELGEDIFMADYKAGPQGQDDYQSDDSEEIEVIKPHGRTKQPDQDRDYDVEMNHSNMQTSAKSKTARKGRKRKSVEVNEDENEHGSPPTKAAKTSKTKSTSKKIPARKARAQTSEKEERLAVQDIFDAIPTVRPPTPPSQSDPSRKFNFAMHTNRNQPAPASGSKEIPVGAENCLAGLTFVFTGVLDALGREEGQELIKRYGGKITTSPSTKTNYVVLGNDAGPKKLETIRKYGLKTINEDGLFALIRTLPADGGDGKEAEKFAAKKKQEEKMIQDLAAEMDAEERKESEVTGNCKAGVRSPNKEAIKQNVKMPSADSQLWTVKYAPTSMNTICGNKTQVEKLQGWLRAWPKHHRVGFRMPGKDGSGVFRAMILHGPPGIGKTTAAHLAAQLEGYDVVESNASDTRSKKLVEGGLRGVLDTTSLLGYFAGDGKKVEVEKKKLVLIMDEVDGMSAGDRGGVGALAAVCKKTSIPMILICNDRKLPKMRPFDKVTYDLPFRRPTADQIRGRIMTICYREGLKISPNVINALIEGTHADIRQIINMLSTAKLDQEAMDYDAGKKMSKAWEKHLILKPWDLVGKILGGGLFASSSNSTLNDKVELYFNDHEFSSLMLQENYLGTNPMLANAYNGNERKYKLLELTDRAAESISDGDLVDHMIHGSQQQWSLMPTHAVFSFVRPASFVSGSMAGHQTRFTTWLGQNSKLGIMPHLRGFANADALLGKLSRMVKEIQGHMRLRASGDRHQIRQEYLPLLWSKLVRELSVKGKSYVEPTIELMDSYYLTKDDWDAILEIGVGPMDMESVTIDTQTKATFTRMYNQMSHPMPFMKASQVMAPKKAGKEKPDLEEAMEPSDGELAVSDAGGEDEDGELDLKNDKYVKAPKRRPKGKKAGAKGKGNANANTETDGEASESEDESIIRGGRPAGAGSRGGGGRGRGRGKK